MQHDWAQDAIMTQDWVVVPHPSHQSFPLSHTPIQGPGSGTSMLKPRKAQTSFGCGAGESWAAPSWASGCPYILSSDLSSW